MGKLFEIALVEYFVYTGKGVLEFSKESYGILRW